MHIAIDKLGSVLSIDVYKNPRGCQIHTFRNK